MEVPDMRVVGFLALLLLFSQHAIADLEPETRDYGTYGAFKVLRVSASNIAFSHCGIISSKDLDGSKLAIYPSLERRKIRLLMMDPTWSLNKRVEGNVQIKTDDYSERARIYDNTKSAIYASITRYADFNQAFIENYSMKIIIPGSTWDIDLNKSEDAWLALERCLGEASEHQKNMKKKNPWE